MSVLEQWNQAAEVYRNKQEKSAYVDLNKAIVKQQFPDLSHKKVLDLGCGYGWYTNYFKRVGGDVIGCDGSRNMIKLAKQKYPNILFEVVDIEQNLPYQEASFDLVFCNLVLMDVENISKVIQSAYRVLKPNGYFYVSIVHPAFYDGEWVEQEGLKKIKTIERYLSTYSFDNEFWGKTRHYHRTISFYLNEHIHAGFSLIHMEEPKTYDGLTKSDEFPLFLFMLFKKRKDIPILNNIV